MAPLHQFFSVPKPQGFIDTGSSALLLPDRERQHALTDC
jgi:hypothetical protein